MTRLQPVDVLFESLGVEVARLSAFLVSIRYLLVRPAVGESGQKWLIRIFYIFCSLFVCVCVCVCVLSLIHI